MARIVVEGWAPEYGAPLDPDVDLAPAEGSVDETYETADWSPRDGVDDDVPTVAFVDGVRRVDARLTLDEPDGPVPGLCGTLAVGAVRWDRGTPVAEVVGEHVERWAVFGSDRTERFPVAAIEPGYGTIVGHDDDPAALVRALHTAMRTAEGRTASALAQEGFVIADGPLNELGPQPAVGYVKTHRVIYLSPERNRVVGLLRAGQRTPAFTIGTFRRATWYVRLADIADGHAWSGIVRCEASAALPLADIATIADRTAALLPLVASEPHADPRAPQNLVPIGSLERTLRHRMGDPRLVYRALREAVMERRAS